MNNKNDKVQILSAIEYPDTNEFEIKLRVDDDLYQNVLPVFQKYNLTIEEAIILFLKEVSLGRKMPE